MSNSNFTSALTTEVNSLSKKFGLTESKSFLIWFSKIAFDLSDEDAFESILADGPNDKSIDLFFVDDYSRRVIIVQGKYSKSSNSKPKDNSVESLLACLDWLSSPEALQREGKLELSEAGVEYLEAVENEYLIELWFVYCGPKNEKIDQRIRIYNANKDNIEKRRVCRHCDIKLIETFFEEHRGKGRRIEKYTLDTISQSIEIHGGFGKGLVTSINALELVNLYSTFGDKLFSRNVRLFLGAKQGSVNAGIKNTIEDDSDKSNFWAYNNGITMICDYFDFNQDAQKLEIKNFSIVNGCQTTVSLFRSKESVNDSVIVLLKVICPPEQAIDSIIRFTNSQNQIRVWDISSQDRTQKRLQHDFENLNQPIYYQLRRGDVQALNSTARRKFLEGRKMRIVRHDMLAQYIMAYKQRPVIAYKHKSFLFTKYYDEIFSPDIKVEEALFIWKSGEILQDKIREEIILDTSKDNALDVLILKRGGRLYSLGVFGLIASLRNGPDYLRTIKEERIISNSASDRISKYALISIIWYKDAVQDLLKIEKKDLSVLVRDANFFHLISSRIESRFRTMSVDKNWLKGALPKLF